MLTPDALPNLRPPFSPPAQPRKHVNKWLSHTQYTNRNLGTHCQIDFPFPSVSKKLIQVNFKMILNLFATPSALPWNHGKDDLVRTPYFRSAEDCDSGGEGGDVWEGAKKVPGAKHRYDSAYRNLKPMQLSLIPA